jgi:asparagine synthase (glutamine-hydrolysing)
MCGIVGVLGPTAQRDLAGALELIRHRGPDSAGHFAAGALSLAMRRLAIIDVEGSDQPIANETGDVTAICNGEIYNYVELRRDLAAGGHRFSTRGDVETIVHLYEEHGVAAFERLRGMFAVALWDDKRQRLVLARDRFGIKPLYLAETREGLAFSSEIKPLLALGASREVDLQAIGDFLSFGYVPGEATGLASIRALAPGHTLVAEGDRTEERPFVDTRPRATASLAETLAESVRIHLRSDVPLAVMLSGGLDSSLIASLAAAEEGAGLHTFTVGFGDAAFDELEPARAIAQAIGSEHHEVHVRADAAADLPAIVEALEEPSGDPSAIPLWYVCRAAAQQVKVALAGEGGDEVFGGYSRYAWDRRAGLVGRALPARRLAELLERLPGVRDRAARFERKGLTRRAIKLLRHAELPPAERYFSWFALMNEEAKAEVLRADRLQPSARVFEALLRSAPAGLTALGRLQWVDLRTMLLKDLLVKADRMSMAHSLELRVPLLDNEVVAAGLALPDREKVRGVETKVALRRLVEARLSRDIARRPKQGFEVPIDRWLREGLKPLATELLSAERLRARGILDPAAVERRLRAHLNGDADHGLQLYSLMSLELWLERVVGTRAPALAT